jgi:hypothetical protein
MNYDQWCKFQTADNTAVNIAIAKLTPGNRSRANNCPALSGAIIQQNDEESNCVVEQICEVSGHILKASMKGKAIMI